MLTDPALASQAGRFVWLELNTDLTENEPVLQKHQADALPTFLVVDPKDEKVVLRWVGSFTVSQAEAFLAEAYEKAKGSVPPATAADAALDRADRLYGAREYAAAAVAYRQALAGAATGWPREARAVEALLYCLQSTEAWPQAVALAQARLPRLAGTPSALVVATSGLDSALELPEGEASRAAAVAALEATLREVLADPRVKAAADDRSSAYGSLVAARKGLGDAAGARQVAGDWAAFLEAEASRATSPESRAVFDSHRLSAYLELGKPQQAVAMLRASERDLPRDYNPPNRLARAYAALGRWKEALAASSRAEALAGGRAKLRVLATRAELLQQKGDAAAARRSYDEAIAFGESLPAAERPGEADRAAPEAAGEARRVAVGARAFGPRGEAALTKHAPQALLAAGLLAATALVRVPLELYRASRHDFTSVSRDVVLSIFAAGLLLFAVLALPALALPARLRGHAEVLLVGLALYGWVRSGFFHGPSAQPRRQHVSRGYLHRSCRVAGAGGAGSLLAWLAARVSGGW